MELLRRILNFGASVDDLKNIYILYVRTLLEQSCSVWHSGLTEENTQDLERVQKSALKIILKDSYQSYENALNKLDIETLEDRRKVLCLQFAKKCLNNNKMKQYLPKNQKTHIMSTRNPEHFQVNHFNTGRLRDSPIIYMQKLLNET